MEKDVEKIAMDGDKYPKLFFALAEGKLNVFSTLGIHKSHGP